MDLLIKRIEYEEINLNPDFQRNANIWTDKAKSRLIESLLIRIPLPAFYMDATKEDEWLIIDGLQRLSTFKSFILDQMLVLKDLEFLQDLETNKYSDLSRNYTRRILVHHLKLSITFLEELILEDYLSIYKNFVKR